MNFGMDIGVPTGKGIHLEPINCIVRLTIIINLGDSDVKLVLSKMIQKQ